jgi:hypothetical protein
MNGSVDHGELWTSLIPHGNSPEAPFRVEGGPELYVRVEGEAGSDFIIMTDLSRMSINRGVMKKWGDLFITT